MTVSAEERMDRFNKARMPARTSTWGRAGIPILRGPAIAVIALVVILGFLSVYPLSMLLYGSLHSTPPGMAGTFNLDGYQEVMTRQNLITLLNTVGISLAKTIPSVVIAVVLAWILARTDTPFRGTLEVLITLPFFIPPILTAMAWGMLGNPQVGLLNQLFQWATGSSSAPINVYSYGGVVWHMMQYSVPFLFLLIVDAFQGDGPEPGRGCADVRCGALENLPNHYAAAHAACADGRGDSQLYPGHRKLSNHHFSLGRRPASGSSRRTFTIRSINVRRRSINTRPQPVLSS